MAQVFVQGQLKMRINGKSSSDDLHSSIIISPLATLTERKLNTRWVTFKRWAILSWAESHPCYSHSFFFKVFLKFVAKWIDWKTLVWLLWTFMVARSGIPLQQRCNYKIYIHIKTASVMATSVNRPVLENHPYFFLYWPCRVVYWALKYSSSFLHSSFAFLMLKGLEIESIHHLFFHFSQILRHKVKQMYRKI